MSLFSVVLFIVACFSTGAFGTGSVCLQRSYYGDTFENTVDQSFCAFFGASCSSAAGVSCGCDGDENAENSNGGGGGGGTGGACGGCTCPAAQPYFNHVVGRCEVTPISNFGFTFRNDLHMPNDIDRRSYRLFPNMTFTQRVSVIGWTVRLLNNRPAASWFLLEVRRWSIFNLYTLVGSSNISVPSSSGAGFTDMDFDIPVAERFDVMAGNFLGIYSPEELDLPFGHEIEGPVTNPQLGAFVYERAEPDPVLSIYTVDAVKEGLGFNFAAKIGPATEDLCIPVPVPFSGLGGNGNNNLQPGGGEGSTQPPTTPTSSQTTTNSLPPATTPAESTTSASTTTTTTPPTSSTTTSSTTTLTTTVTITTAVDPIESSTSSLYATTPTVTEQPRIPATNTSAGSNVTPALTIEPTGAANLQKSTFPTASVAGGLAGGVGLLIAAGFLVFAVSLCIARRKRKNAAREVNDYAVPEDCARKTAANQPHRREYHFYEGVSEAQTTVPPVHTYATLEMPEGVEIGNRHSGQDISAHYEVDSVFMSQRSVSTRGGDPGNSVAVKAAPSIPSHYEIDADLYGHSGEQRYAMYEPQTSPTSPHIYEEATSGGLKEPASYEEFVSATRGPKVPQVIVTDHY